MAASSSSDDVSAEAFRDPATNRVTVVLRDTYPGELRVRASVTGRSRRREARGVHDEPSAELRPRRRRNGWRGRLLGPRPGRLARNADGRTAGHRRTNGHAV